MWPSSIPMRAVIVGSRGLCRSARMMRDGWLSKLMTGRAGASQASAGAGPHSSLLSDRECVYELVTHTTKPGEMDKYLANYGEFVSLMRKKEPNLDLVGSWRVMMGNVDEAVHLWRHNEGYSCVDRVLSLQTNDEEVKSGLRDQGTLCRKRKNCLMLMFSFWGDTKPRPPQNIYELRSYILRPGTMIEWGNYWARGINYRTQFNQDVGGFFSQIGGLYMVFHFWAYKDLESRKTIREETWQQPGWESTVSGTVPLVKRMRSQIMVPNAFSLMQ